MPARDPLVFDARINRWRYLGRIIPTASGNVQATRRAAEGHPVSYIDPAGRHRTVAPSRITAYPPVTIVVGPPVEDVTGGGGGGPRVITATDAVGALAEAFGWDVRFTPSGQAILEGEGRSYREAAGLLRLLLRDPSAEPLFRALPRLHVLWRVILAEGGFDWIPAVPVIRGDVAISQARQKLLDWARRYRDSLVVAVQLTF